MCILMVRARVCVCLRGHLSGVGTSQGALALKLERPLRVTPAGPAGFQSLHSLGEEAGVGFHGKPFHSSN